ncbi:YmdB family metallophosphoesterase [candidate division WOR-3 bacterium]|nr:YmdB family metallophosphoesterase [candidate division WOR-3 bacterium]
MKILFIGDIVGNPGKEIIATKLPALKKEEQINFVIANGECAGEDGSGLKPQDVEELISLGIDCITSGEEVWRKKEIVEFLETSPSTLLRPLNYPLGVPGLGSFIYKPEIAVINLLGRAFLVNVDCPFRIGLSELEKISPKAKIIIIDFHAQATAEKQAFGWWVDGKASAVIGTHTKIQTSDERILPGGTAYITSAGLTGIQDAVGGMKKELYIDYFLKGIPIKFKPAPGKGKLSGVILNINKVTGKALSIQRIQLG